MSLRCTLLINMLVVDKLNGFTFVRLVGCNFSCNSHCCLMMLLLLYIDKTKRQHSGNSRVLSRDLVNLTAAVESASVSRRSVLHKTHGRSWETNLSLSSTLPAHSWITQFFLIMFL